MAKRKDGPFKHVKIGVLLAAHFFWVHLSFSNVYASALILFTYRIFRKDDATLAFIFPWL